MTAPVAMNHCPTEETLAAFIDDRLDRTARQRVIEHMATCAECRDVVMVVEELEADKGIGADSGGGGTVSRFSPRAMFTAAAALAAAAVLIVVLSPWMLPGLWPTGSGTDDLLVASSALQYRSIAGRLSIPTPYRTLKPVTRGNGRDAGSVAELRIAAVAADLYARAAASNSARDLHRAGVAQLVAGNSAKGVQLLEQALRAATDKKVIADAIASSRNADLLSDLSAAYLQRRESSDDVLAAADCAERAWSISRTVVTAWNRALAREKLGMRSAARAAWSQYLALDADSAWSREALEHIERLRLPTDSEGWLRDSESLLNAASSSGNRNVVEIVRKYPQQTRSLIEDTLLPRAAASGSAPNMQAAYRVADALHQISGDRSLLDSAMGIMAVYEGNDARRQQKLRAGYAAYASGVEAYRAEDLSRARSRFNAAGDLLSGIDEVAISRSWLYLAICLYYDGKYAECRAVIENLTKAGDTARPESLMAMAKWVTGLTWIAEGDPYAAIESFDNALATFLARGESENAMAMHNLLAEAKSYCGEDTDAAVHRGQALALLNRIGVCRREHVVLTEGAEHSLRMGYSYAALLFHDYLIARARHSGNLRELADALSNRVAVLMRQGMRSDAFRDLDAARDAVARIHDNELRTLAEYDLEIVDARLNPSGYSEVRYRAATDYWRRRRNYLRLAAVHVANGEAQLASGNSLQAARAFEDALDSLDRARVGVHRDWGSWSIVPERHELCNRLARLALERNDAEGAFEFVDRGRIAYYDDLALPAKTDVARRTTHSTLAETRRNVRAGEVVVVYALLHPDLVIWTISSTTWDVRRAPFSEPPVEALTQRAVLNPTPPEDGTLERLFDILVAPIREELTHARRIVFVPDRAFSSVPFAALRDASRKRYLVEDHDVAVAPSAALYVRSIGVRGRGPSDQNILAVAVPGRVSDDQYLAGASDEAIEVARLYSRKQLLVGDGATTAAIVKGVAESTMVHWAGHGQANARFPRFTALSLGNGQKLYVHDILRLHTRHLRVVFVAACDTGWTASGLDAGSALAEAFLLSGATQVIAANGPAADLGSSAFAVAVHRFLAQGLGASAALSAAQRDAMRSGHYGSWYQYQAYGA